MAYEITGPYLNAALLCERVLSEADGILTAVRIIDRFIVSGPNPEMFPATLPMSLLIMLKSGDFRGPSVIKLITETPSAQQLPTLEFQVNFEGDNDRGVNVVANISFQAQEPGIYWFTLLQQEQPLTRIPLRVLYQRTA
ncbi:MAG: DUF6941 family protein [Terriglobia bacterium]